MRGAMSLTPRLVVVLLTLLLLTLNHGCHSQQGVVHASPSSGDDIDGGSDVDTGGDDEEGTSWAMVDGVTGEPLLEPSSDEIRAISNAPNAAGAGWFNLQTRLDDCKYWSIALSSVSSPISSITARGVPSHVIMSPDIIARTHPEVWLEKIQLTADPFLFRHWDLDVGSWRWYLFFEAWKERPVIAWARQRIDDPMLEREFEFGGIVTGLEPMKPPCGLSYPYIFRGDPDPHQATPTTDTPNVQVGSQNTASAPTTLGPAYMIPSSACKRDPLKLYVAKVFPDEWELVTTLASCNPKCGDSDMIKWGGKWFLFLGVNDSRQRHSSHTRKLLVSDTMAGPYTPHPASPLRLVRKDFARGAGRMVPWGNKYIVRYSQHYVNGEHRYGDMVVASVITQLTETSFQAKYSKHWVINTPALHRDPSASKAWNAEGVHHVDMHPLHNGSWVAVHDGRESCGVTKRRDFHMCWKRRNKNRGKGPAVTAACQRVCDTLIEGGSTHDAVAECKKGTFLTFRGIGKRMLRGDGDGDDSIDGDDM